MNDVEPTRAQLMRLVSASENLAAYFAMDACRVIVEWPDDANLVPYLENLPVKVVREFDEATADIQRTMMDGKPPFAESAEQIAKYEKALAEMRGEA